MGGYRESQEIRNPMTGFLDRLRLLGATDAEVEDIVSLMNDDDVDPINRKTVMNAPDAQIVELIAAMRVGDTDPSEAFAAGAGDTSSGSPNDGSDGVDDAEVAARAADAARAAHAGAVAAWEFDHGDEFNLDQLAAWVGDDAARAAVAHERELAREDGGRKGAAELFERFDATPL